MSTARALANDVVRLQVAPGLYAYALGLMAEAGVDAMPVGAAEFTVSEAQLTERLSAEQADELAKITGGYRPPTGGAVVPVGDEDGGTPAPVVAPPPKAGPGATRAAWAAWAEQQGVTVPEGATRDEIIGLTEGHG